MNPSKFDIQREEVTFFINREEQKVVATTGHPTSLTGFLTTLYEYERDDLKECLEWYSPVTVFITHGFITAFDGFITDAKELFRCENVIDRRVPF